MRRLRQLHGKEPEQGSAALELAIIGSVFILLLIAIIAVARWAGANTSVDGAADAAARAASIARTSGQAQSDASSAARSTLQQSGLDCTPTVSVDTSGFATQPGQPGTVRVTVSCTVPMGDLALPGLGGSRTLTASSISAIDTYRERT